MNNRELIKSLLSAGNFVVSMSSEDYSKVNVFNQSDEKTETETEYGSVEYEFDFTIPKVEFIELLKEANIEYFSFNTSVDLKGIEHFFSFKTVNIPKDKFDDFANNDEIDLDITATIDCGKIDDDYKD